MFVCSTGEIRMRNVSIRLERETCIPEHREVLRVDFVNHTQECRF